MLVEMDALVIIEKPIEEKIKTSQILFLSPREYYFYSNNTIELLKEKILPIAVKEEGNLYSFKKMKIELYNSDTLEKIKNTMLDFYLVY